MATCAQEERKSLDEQPLTIIVCGKVQTGKSSLINSIASKKLATERQSPTAQTLKTESHDFETKSTGKRSIKVKVWDTPGFGGDEQSIKDAVGSIAEKFKGADLLVYCMDMRKRPEQDDVDAMMQLTKLLGPDLLKNVVFALTFSNEVSHSKKKFFEEHLSQWQTLIRDRLLQNKLSMPKAITDEVPIIPTGYRRTPPIDRDDWLTPFWQAVSCKSKCSAQMEAIDAKSVVHHKDQPVQIGYTPAFVVCGKVQAGKSSLISSIAGLKGQSALARGFPTTIEAVDIKTQTYKSRRRSMHFETSHEQAISVKFCDIPGLGDTDQRATMKAIADHFRNADLLIFCIDMRKKLEEDDIQAITQLTEHCGEGLWNNAIFALTFANDVKPPPHSSEDPVEFFKTQLSQQCDAIRHALERLTAKDVPVVPTGLRDVLPPDRDNWITPLLEVAFRKSKRSTQLRSTSQHLSQKGVGHSSTKDDEVLKRRLSLSKPQWSKTYNINNKV